MGGFLLPLCASLTWPFSQVFDSKRLDYTSLMGGLVIQPVRRRTQNMLEYGANSVTRRSRRCSLVAPTRVFSTDSVTIPATQEPLVSELDLSGCLIVWKMVMLLIVTKLDRLGRNAMDIRKMVEQLAALDIRVHCLALGGVDLTSPAGKMTM